MDEPIPVIGRPLFCYSPRSLPVGPTPDVPSVYEAQGAFTVLLHFSCDSITPFTMSVFSGVLNADGAPSSAAGCGGLALSC